MTLRTHPFLRIVDVLVFALAIYLLLTLLSCFAPVYSQVCNTSAPATAGGSGDMLVVNWANGSAEGNPNVVDHAAYAGGAGSASSASYAGNATQWNGFDMPGDPGFNSYVAFLSHDQYGQLTWIQADSWRGPQGDQGPAGEMTAGTWANGSGYWNPNLLDHALYADSAGTVDHASSADTAGWADSAGSVESAGNATQWASHGWPDDAVGALLNDGSGNLSWASFFNPGTPLSLAVPAYDQDGTLGVSQSPSLMGLTLRSQSGSFAPLSFTAPEAGVTVNLVPEVLPGYATPCHLLAQFPNSVTETIAYTSDLTVAQEPINSSYVWVLANATRGDPPGAIPGGKYISSDNGQSYVCETDANFYLYSHAENDGLTYWTLKEVGGDGLAARGLAHPGTGTGFLGKYFNTAMNGGSVISVISPVALQNDAVKAEPRVIHYHDTVLDQDVALTVLELKPVGL
jgi:hypothetical protein